MSISNNSLYFKDQFEKIHSSITEIEDSFSRYSSDYERCMKDSSREGIKKFFESASKIVTEAFQEQEVVEKLRNSCSKVDEEGSEELASFSQEIKESRERLDKIVREIFPLIARQNPALFIENVQRFRDSDVSIQDIEIYGGLNGFLDPELVISHIDAFSAAGSSPHMMRWLCDGIIKGNPKLFFDYFEKFQNTEFSIFDIGHLLETIAKENPRIFKENIARVAECCDSGDLVDFVA